MDVGDFLRELGLQQYEAAFRENAIDAKVLPTLTGDDLKEMGVVPIGHRRRLLEAIADLRRQVSPDGVSVSPPASQSNGTHRCVRDHR
jgi:SAM domain (Sterile alpha motif)